MNAEAWIWQCESAVRALRGRGAVCTPHGFFCEGCFWNGVFLGRVWCVLYIYLSLKGVCHSWAKKRGRGRDSGQKESQSGQKKTSSGQKAWKWAKVRVWGKFNHYIGKQQQLRLGFWILGVWIFRPTVSVIVSLTNGDLLPVPIAGTDRTRSMAKPSWSWGTCSQWGCWCSSSLPVTSPGSSFPVTSHCRSFPCLVSRSLLSLSRLPVALVPVTSPCPSFPCPDVIASVFSQILLWSCHWRTRSPSAKSAKPRWLPNYKKDINRNFKYANWLHIIARTKWKRSLACYRGTFHCPTSLAITLLKTRL